MNAGRHGRRIGGTATALLIAILVAGCASATSGGGSGAGGSGPGGSGPGGSGPGGSSSVESITGTWQLIRGTDSKGTISPGTAEITLKLDGKSSGGHGPCNAFGATASSGTTGAISIRVGIHTDMACAEAVLNTTEARYFAALGTVTAASIANSQLMLSGDGDTLLFARATT